MYKTHGQNVFLGIKTPWSFPYFCLVLIINDYFGEFDCLINFRQFRKSSRVTRIGFQEIWTNLLNFMENSNWFSSRAMINLINSITREFNRNDKVFNFLHYFKNFLSGTKFAMQKLFAQKCTVVTHSKRIENAALSLAVYCKNYFRRI